MNEIMHGFRPELKPSDIDHVGEIVRSTGFFREDEVLVAIELLKERLDKGPESGYEFVFAEAGGRPVAYTCYGPIPCSLISYDLYWIVTHNAYRGKGIGRLIMAETESLIRKAGGKAIYIETSSKEMYKPTRIFYEKNNYMIKARCEDFYDMGDDKLVYIKKLAG